MLNFYKKNKKFILPLILFTIYIYFIIVTWGKWGHIIADCFREILIPQALLEGKILYSDITCIYPPLAYQLNALLFKLFGSSINVMYFVGIFNSTIILSLLYFITKKYSSDFTAFITVLTVMLIFTFRIITLNSAAWFFPYSYSFIYAFSSCLGAFVFYLLYVENKNKKYLYLTSLFAGISVAFKPDFLLFALLPLFGAIKTKSVKSILFNITCFIAPILTTFGIYLLTGGSFENLVQYKDFLVNFAKAPSVLVFNDNILIQSINRKSFAFAKMSTIGFLLDIAQIIILCGLITLAYKKIKLFILQIPVMIILFAITFITLNNISLTHLHTFHLHICLVFLSYLIILSAFIIFLKKIKERNYTYKEKFYFLLTIGTFLMSYRIWAAVFISYIGNFIVILYWLAFVYLLLELLPEYFPAIDNNFYKKFISAVLIIYGFTYSNLYFANAATMNVKVLSDKGTFYGGSHTATINQAIQYTNENIPEDKTILVVEEGSIINYLTDRKTNMKYYALIPHIVDTVGEEKIISDLRQTPTDYIFITRNFYPFAGYFGEHYAKKIINYILENYEYIESFSGKDGFEIAILKKK